MLTRLTAPAVEPVTLAEAKAHVAAIGDSDDTLLARLISAAVDALDGADGRLGRCLILQKWRLDLAGFPSGYLRLPLPPVISVESVSFIDSAGDEQPFADFEVMGIGSTGDCILAPRTLWPYARVATVEFTAGFGAAAGDVPEDIRNAILSAVATSYALRESVSLLSISMQSNPEVADVIQRWRTRGVGG